MILGKYIKQPSEVSDYDIDFAQWARFGETLLTSGATAICTTDATDTALVVVSVTVSSSALRIRLSGGTAGQSYQVTALTETSSGRIDESEFIVLVKEY